MRMTALLVAATVAAGPLAAQTAIGDLRGDRLVEIEGTVTAAFGNRFVVDDGTGSVLVTSGPTWHHRFELTPGERVRISGEPDGAEFDAFRIMRASGEVIEVRPAAGPPPWSGGRHRSRD